MTAAIGEKGAATEASLTQQAAGKRQAASRAMLIFLDTETTGLDPTKTHVVEIALRVADAVTGEILGSFESVVLLSEEQWSHATAGALRCNGFTYDEVLKRGVPLQNVAKKIEELFTNLKINGRNASFYCQNPTFDRPFFHHIFPSEYMNQKKWPYHWLDLASASHFLNMQQYRKNLSEGENSLPKIPFSKDRIAAQHDLPKEKSPHRAMNGVDHLMLIHKHLETCRCSLV